ncbi:MAG: hypothetical protein IH845_01075 [Nanoarchaeota archaeon]|nr:hypothetical protein [Nanoarchaeota archaeon]
MSSTSLTQSNNDQERSWYSKGVHEGWLKDFSFGGVRQRWTNLQDWKQHGLDHEHNERTSTSLSRSEIDEERAWYSKGQRNDWLNDFSFIATRLQRKKSIEEILKETPEALEIGSLVTLTDDSYSVAEILVEMYPDRFPPAAELARSLPGAIKHVGHSLVPFTLGHAKSFYEEIGDAPKRVYQALDDILSAIMINQYQIPFNSNPNKTLKELRKFKQGKSDIAKLARKVSNHYTEVYNFRIPGHGSLKGKAA